MILESDVREQTTISASTPVAPATLTKADLIDKISGVLEPRERKRRSRIYRQQIVRALDRGEKIEIRGLGRFAPGRDERGSDIMQNRREGGSAGQENRVLKTSQDLPKVLQIDSELTALALHSK